jgi:hypothetical protein
MEGKKMSLKDLLSVRDGLLAEQASLFATIKDEMDAIGEKLKTANAEMTQYVAAQTAQLRKMQAKEFGTVNCVVDGIAVKGTVDKTVSWDNEKLFDIYGQILASADDPFKYMKAKFSVSEKDYKVFAPEIRAVFEPARTVKPGVEKFEFEEVENA